MKDLPPWLRLSLIFPLVFLNGWLLFRLISFLEPLGSIFVTATLLAFLLDFPMHFLRERGLSRGGALAVVLLLALLAMTVLALILVPAIVKQLSELVVNLPRWIESGSQQLRILQEWVIAKKLDLDFEGILAEATGRLSNTLQSLTSQLLNLLLGAIGSIINIILILVLTVFLIISGESVWNGIFSWFPPPWNVQLRESTRKTFTQYFAGQAILAGILSLAQILVFVLLDVPYALLFGLTIGVTTLIPYASAISIVAISFLLMLQDFGLGVRVAAAAIVVGQINDNVVAPRLVGKMTGVNPVWILVALFIGGKFGGVLGLLIAVPLASVVKSTVDRLRVGTEGEREEGAAVKTA